MNTIGSWHCECPSEYKGHNCMEHVNLCEVNPCRNEGTCIDYGSHIICLCEPGNRLSSLFQALFHYCPTDAVPLRKSGNDH